MDQEQGGRSFFSHPDSYAYKVFEYSRHNVQDLYFSGLHYNRLGKFLTSPYRTYGGDVTVPIENHNFQSVTLVDLSRGISDTKRTAHFSDPQKFWEALEISANKLREQDSSQHEIGNSSLKEGESQATLKSRYMGKIVFLRGFPTAQWLNHLGAALDIDPELFNRHLELEDKPPLLRLEHTYSTPFPKSSDLIQLRICNTGSLRPEKPGFTLSRMRAACDDSMRQHKEQFTRLHEWRLGDSMVRQFTLHNMHNFSIEQKVSVEVIHHTLTWSIVVWLDAGKDLSLCKTGPWVSCFPYTETVTFHPVFQHRSRMALSCMPKHPDRVSSGSVHNTSQPQSINHLHQNYGRFLKGNVMACDAFYALTELFEFSAASVDQLLEMCEDGVRDTSRRSDEPRLTELLRLQTFVDDYRSYIKDTLETVQDRGGAKWPRSKDPNYMKKADDAANQLESRYRRLLERCERLQQYCASSISISLNQQSQDQAEFALEQTKQLNKLSILAYFFIPLTFVASFFGMNFKELGTGLSLWTYFAVVVPLLTASIMAWTIDVGALVGLCRWRSKRILS